MVNLLSRLVMGYEKIVNHQEIVHEKRTCIKGLIDLLPPMYGVGRLKYVKKSLRTKIADDLPS